jgi:hypothetical protein
MVSLNSLVTPELRAAAYCYGDEFAWTRDDALKVVDWASKCQIAIAGVEVWLATKPGPTIPTPLIYSWQAEKELYKKPWPRFVKEANYLATEYIKHFAWDVSDTSRYSLDPYFNLCLMERPNTSDGRERR